MYDLSSGFFMGVRLGRRSTKHCLQRFCKTRRHLQRVMAGLPASRRVVGESFAVLGRTFATGSGGRYHPTENDSVIVPLLVVIGLLNWLKQFLTSK